MKSKACSEEQTGELDDTKRARIRQLRRTDHAYQEFSAHQLALNRLCQRDYGQAFAAAGIHFDNMPERIKKITGGQRCGF